MLSTGSHSLDYARPLGLVRTFDGGSDDSASLRQRGRAMLRQALARLIIRLSRWQTVGRAPSSGILVGAPHTSNWDWVAMLLLTWQDGVQARALIKRELFRGPLAPLLRSTGGIPLDRRNPGETVRALLAEAESDKAFL